MQSHHKSLGIVRVFIFFKLEGGFGLAGLWLY
jgi:hypothetical protein